MAKPVLYGTSGSRALRSIWAMEEVGIDYEHVPTNFREQSKTPEYMAINPNGRIPALVDGDVTLFESMAINLYLAKTYGANLYPAGAADEARTWQWTVWGMTEIEPLQMQIVVQKFFAPSGEPDAAVIRSAAESLERPFKVLDQHLGKRHYLLGDTFTVADLNLAGVMGLLAMVEHDYSAHANVKRWADACYGRPSYASARGRG